MSTLTPVETPLLLADQAFERILSAIITGEIPPGEYIKEARVAKQLNISRGPLREAIGKLEGYKLLVRTPNMGARVIAFTPSDIEELFSIRGALEGLCCQLAATMMTNEELESLEHLVERMRERPEGALADSYQAADEDFHIQIIRGSRNSRLIRLLCQDIYYQLRVIRHYASKHGGRARNVYKEHRKILDALQERDPKRAESAMRKHIANARETALKIFETIAKNQQAAKQASAD